MNSGRALDDDPLGAHRFARERPALRPLSVLAGKRKGLMLALGGASVGAGLAEASLLALVADLATTMAAGHHQLDSNLGAFDIRLTIGVALAVAAVLASARMLFQIVIAWLPARISATVQAQLRRELFSAYTNASWSLQAGEAEGHLQELMTGQVFQAVVATLAIAGSMSSGIMFLALLASGFALNVLAAVIVLVGAAALFVVLRPLTRHGHRAAQDLSEASMGHANTISESARLAEEAQVFGTANAFQQRAGVAIAKAEKAFFSFQLTNRLVQALYQSFVIFLVVGGLAALYFSGQGDFAALGAIVLILIRASSYGQQLQGGYHSLVQSQPYVERLALATNTYRESAPADGDRPLEEIQNIAFENVSFAYAPNRQVLHDVSFAVSAGSAIGIVGPSGAGKSTLVQILLRLREPSSGAYLVNGVPANSFLRASWHDRVAYISQEPRIFQGTVAENIRFFRDLDDASVERAAHLAHIHDEIMLMPRAYDTIIGQRADAVSGGQRQRICLARALAARPDVLVLDEPTSALDAQSESAIEASLQSLVGHLTLFLVAHRPNILRVCDRVIVLVDGRIEGFDSAIDPAKTNHYFADSSAHAS